MASAHLITYMKSRGFLYLGQESFFIFMEPEWWARFKPFMAGQGGKWVPVLSTINDLNNLLKEYKEYNDKKWGAEMNEKQRLRSLTSE